MTHIVGKLTWNITCAQQENASAVTQEASLLANSSAFNNAVEAWCIQQKAEKNLLVFNKVELDLGTISGEDWPQKLKTKLLQAFENGQAAATNRADNSALKVTPNKQNSEPIANWATQAFMHFLLRGMMHPNVPSNVRTTENFVAWYVQILGDSAREETINLLQQIAGNTEAQKRLLSFSLDEIWRAFAEIISTEKTKSKQLLQFFLGVEATLKKSKTATKVQVVAWQKLAWAALYAEVNSSNFPAKQTTEFLQKMMAAATKSKDLALLRSAKNALELLQKITKADVLPRAKKPETVVKINKKESVKKKQEIQKDEEFQALTENQIFIRNAGLVLVAPWLPKFFQSLGLVVKGKIISPEKAIRLLEFLDMGDVNFRAADLTLYRFLCGLWGDETIFPAKNINPKEIEACNDLLSSIISSWKELKNTTPDGLREGFFWREGIIKNINEHPILVIEQKGQDILLSFLPWGIGLIKLPWMPKPITVNWG